MIIFGVFFNSGLGEYHLRTAYQTAKIDTEDLVLVSTRSPDAIVQHLRDKTLEDNTECMMTANLDDESKKLSTTSQTPATQLCRARALVEENKISFNPKMHVFNVQGTHDVRVVSLYPKEKCSCPARSMCYHILGVKLSLGAQETGSSKEKNTTQLRKNTLSKNDKKSGRK